MAAVIRGCALLAVAGCGDLVGFGGAQPPLTTIQLSAIGDFESVRIASPDEPDLRVALVWGEQWLPEALCILPPASPEVAAVITQGCRDVLSFTPARAGSSVAIDPNAQAELSLFELPSADVMVGGVIARVAFGSLVVFDDRDHDGTLELGSPPRLPGDDGGGGPNGGDEDGDRHLSPDIIYGASFVAMSEPDRRLAFREGGYTETAFYPRLKCGEPLPGFSILSAGGFSLQDAIAATAASQLPAQDPTTCAEHAPAETVVEIPLRPPTEVGEVACSQRRNDSIVRYQKPPAEEPRELADRPRACTSIPTFGPGEGTEGIVQLVVGSSPVDRCRGLTHYTLVGCDDGQLVCDSPEWDIRTTPPAWWPCPAEVAP
jgi:hypothetical protein